MKTIEQTPILIEKLQPFSLPFWRFRLMDWPEKKKKLKKILPTWTDEHKHGSCYTDYHILNADKRLPNYCQEVLTIMENELLKWQAEINIPYLDIIDMWSQTYDEGGHHPYHNHGAQGFGAILYVDLPNKLNTTVFFAPFLDPVDGNVVAFQPEVNEGDVIVFPAMLGHESPPNPGYAKKTIISFNIRGNTAQAKLRMNK